MAIVGPTAVGKSLLALELAERLGGEIVSADSRQVYRHLDVGTAKPGPVERARIRHHLIDLVEPEGDYSLAEFQEAAYAAVDGVLGRGKVPLLVGGTGLYVRAVVDGLDLPRVPPDLALREELEAFARERGPAALHVRLGGVDPVAASRIDPRNVRRVIRALEVSLKSGRPFSSGSIPRPRYQTLTIGLTRPRPDLYRIIDARVDMQVASGMVEETRAVLARGCPPSRPALASFGYREIVAYLQGRLTLAEAAERYRFETHRFARQQNAWFRRDDPRICWLEVDQRTLERASEAIRAFLEGRCPNRTISSDAAPRLPE